MTVSELKLNLITQIIATNDIDLLSNINTLLKENKYFKSNENLSLVNEPLIQYESLINETVRIFSEEEQKKINLALEQYKNGECISDEEAQKEIQIWLED
ncbi:hypothetical protein [Flavobacterium sp.]|uniref:hypothetical protein n=1 Tax=Flavobacterium sp. TaxID=239 RepID=UPI00286DF62C|nr:hypothetical protein [Flavobacterium sp.]